MENAEPTSGSTTTTTYAGFWWRFLAYLIDDIILSFATFIIFTPVWAVMGFSLFRMANWSDPDWNFDHGMDPGAWQFIGSVVGLAILTGFLSVVIQWLYYSLMESSKYQATLGKMAVGARVTDLEGNRISFARATGRYFGKIISGMILMIGYIMAGFTEKKQALHDMIANTLVIKVLK
ncbi:MAG TPA: RDD family protein [Bacteroidales bacterium]|nr:RDD family protein [Bacteroidales bacterium]